MRLYTLFTFSIIIIIFLSYKYNFPELGNLPQKVTLETFKIWIGQVFKLNTNKICF